MSKILIIGEPEIIEGFALTGARIMPLSNPAQAERLVNKLIRSWEADIVVFTESLFEEMPEKARNRAETSGRPVFVSLPSPAGIKTWAGREDLISRVIRRSIGYRLKLRR